MKKMSPNVSEASGICRLYEEAHGSDKLENLLQYRQIADPSAIVEVKFLNTKLCSGDCWMSLAYIFMI